MSKKVKTVTALLLAFVMICPLFVSCSKTAKNDVFDDDFFSNVAAAEVSSSIDIVNIYSDKLKGRKLEKLEKLLSELELEKTDESLISDIPELVKLGSGSSISLIMSDGKTINIRFSDHIITLSKFENYYCDEFIYRKLMEPFGIGVDEDGAVYVLSE